MAEGAPLLREYRVYSPIEGSNPSLSAINQERAIESKKFCLGFLVFPTTYPTNHYKKIVAL